MFVYFIVSVCLVLISSIAFTFFLNRKRMLKKSTVQAIIIGSFSIMLVSVLFPFTVGYLMNFNLELNDSISFKLGMGFSIIMTLLLYFGIILYISVTISNILSGNENSSNPVKARNNFIYVFLKAAEDFIYGLINHKKDSINGMEMALALENQNMDNSNPAEDGKIITNISPNEPVDTDRNVKFTSGASKNDEVDIKVSWDSTNNSQAVDLPGLGEPGENILQKPVDREENIDTIGVETENSISIINNNSDSFQDQLEDGINAVSEAELDNVEREAGMKNDSIDKNISSVSGTVEPELTEKKEEYIDENIGNNNDVTGEYGNEEEDNEFEVTEDYFDEESIGEIYSSDMDNLQVGESLSYDNAEEDKEFEVTKDSLGGEVEEINSPDLKELQVEEGLNNEIVSEMSEDVLSEHIDEIKETEEVLEITEEVEIDENKEATEVDNTDKNLYLEDIDDINNMDGEGIQEKLPDDEAVVSEEIPVNEDVKEAAQRIQPAVTEEIMDENSEKEFDSGIEEVTEKAGDGEFLEETDSIEEPDLDDAFAFEEMLVNEVMQEASVAVQPVALVNNTDENSENALEISVMEIERDAEAADSIKEKINEVDKVDDNMDMLDDYVGEAFNLKAQGDFEGAILNYMYALEQRPEDDLAFWLVLDICALYKQLGKADLAKNILEGYISQYGNVMNEDVRSEIERNL